MGVDGSERWCRGVYDPRRGIELTIRLLLCDSFAWPYKTIFMFVIVLVLLRTGISWHEVVTPGLLCSPSQLDESDKPTGQEVPGQVRRKVWKGDGERSKGLLIQCV